VAQKNDTPTLIISLLMTIALVGAGFWWLGRNWLPFSTGTTQDAASSVSTASPNLRLSRGEVLLVSAEAPAEKQAGVEAVQVGNYPLAISKFQAALQKHRNDPETLIYLNNTKAGKMPAWAIAVSVPIGSNLNVAQEILRGVAQAQEEVNQAGGINGKWLTVMIANDDNEADTVKKVATDLIANSVTAVVGHNASSASLVAAPLYQKAGLVMISPTSFANGLSGFGDAIFRSIPAIRFMADPLAEYAVTTARKTSMALCSDSKAPDNQSFRDEFSGSFIVKGGKLVTIDCDFADPKFDAQAAMVQAIRGGADSILLTAHVDRIDRAMALAQANQRRLALFASHTLYTMQTVKQGQSNVNGMVLSVPWHPAASSANFVAQAQTYWGGAVNWRTATAYDATRAIIAGLQQLPKGSENPRQQLLQVLHQGEFETTGAAGRIAFLPTGDRVSPPVLVQVQPGGAAGYRFELLK
jgi:branched-chain amino acid transport system substrate-binding protein